MVLAVLSRKAFRLPWSLTTSLTSRRVLLSAGLKYLVPWLACRPLPWYHVALPWMNCCSDLLVLGSSVLKTWSRSTIGVVLSAVSVAPSSSLGF